jgi:hypothetical protein
MESHEVLRDAFKPVGIKSLSKDMRLSPSLLYKWCEPKSLPGEAGTDNPLDRLQEIISLTGNMAPIEWLCQRNGGFFVANPQPATGPQPILTVTQNILREFSELLETLSASVANDGGVSAAESKAIRKEWEDLKRLAEGLVQSCEHGHYR